MSSSVATETSHAGVALLIKQQWGTRLENRSILVFAMCVSHLKHTAQLDRTEMIQFFADAIGRDMTKDSDAQYMTNEFDYLIGEMDVRGFYG